MAKDPGLQPERTALAWTRTLLLVAANAALFVRGGLQSGHVPTLSFGIGLAMLGALIGLMAHGRRYQLVHSNLYRMTEFNVGLIASATVLSAAAAVWIIWH